MIISMKLMDYHTHNRRCGHALSEIEDYVLVAIDKNFSEIGISDHFPLGTIIDELQFKERQKLLQIYEHKKLSVSKNILKSVIAPGWGHFTAKRYTKGQILLGLEVILIGSGIYYYDQAMENYDKYKKADYIGDIEKYYTDANTHFRYSKILFSFGIIVWLYTMYDTVQVTEEYNNELWDNINMEYSKINLIVTPTGFTLRF